MNQPSEIVATGQVSIETYVDGDGPDVVIRARRLRQQYRRRPLHRPFNPALLSPVTSGQFLAFQAAEEQNTSLTARERQAVILAVGAVWRSAYELYAHSAAAQTAGLPAETVRALAAGQIPGGLSAAEQAAWRFRPLADRRPPGRAARLRPGPGSVRHPWSRRHAVPDRRLPDRLWHPQRLRNPSTGDKPSPLNTPRRQCAVTMEGWQLNRWQLPSWQARAAWPGRRHGARRRHGTFR